nr:MAG TPA: hypothetical protein [Caudoviricetes sp.]
MSEVFYDYIQILFLVKRLSHLLYVRLIYNQVH